MTKVDFFVQSFHQTLSLHARVVLSRLVTLCQSAGKSFNAETPASESSGDFLLVNANKMKKQKQQYLVKTSFKILHYCHDRKLSGVLELRREIICLFNRERYKNSTNKFLTYSRASSVEVSLTDGRTNIFKHYFS